MFEVRLAITRVRPWELPLLCGGEKRSNPNTFTPRRAQMKHGCAPHAAGAQYNNVVRGHVEKAKI